MAFESLRQVFGTLETQEGWRSRRQFQQLVACWIDVVGVTVAAQTRPIAIQRHVLQVATANAAWAQNLSFERQRLLEKINARLALGLTDIRFSTAQWQKNFTLAQSLEISRQGHPSWVPEVPQHSPPPKPPILDPDTAFQHWATQMKARSQHLPLCPQCHCPTPPGELERWSACSLCAPKQW